MFLSESDLKPHCCITTYQKVLMIKVAEPEKNPKMNSINKTIAVYTADE